MATASRRSSFDGLTTAVMEQWLNDNNAEDIVFTATPTLAMLYAAADKRKLAADLVLRLRDQKGDGVDSFTYYDTVSTTPIKGNTAAKFTVPNYSAPIAMSWQEEQEFTSDQAIYDAVNDKFQTQLNTMAERLATDVFKGDTANSKNLVGLEQLYPGFNHVTVAAGGATGATADTDSVVNRWQLRKATNTYGGITRTAWTDTVDGTPWTGNAINHFGTEFAMSSGAPNAGLQRLYDAVAMSSYGMDKVNVMISGYEPFRDYENAMAGIQEIQRAGANLPGGEIYFNENNIMFKGAVWYWDDFCKQYNVFADEVATGSSIYGLNTKYHKFVVDSRADMKLTDMREPTNQHANVKHILFRGQNINKNPRMGFRMFNYAASNLN